jgi:hypothetical protein
MNVDNREQLRQMQRNLRVIGLALENSAAVFRVCGEFHADDRAAAVELGRVLEIADEEAALVLSQQLRIFTARANTQVRDDLREVERQLGHAGSA